MRVRKFLWLASFLVLAMVLSSCNLGATPVPTQDLAAVQTQAFNAVLTQVAAQSSPTPLPTNTLLPTSTLAALPTFAPVGGGDATPIPFNTQQPVLGITPLASPIPTVSVFATITTKNGCNDGILVKESEPFDGDVLQRGKAFEKVFQFLNTGSCVWDEGYTFAFLPDFSSPGFKGSDIVIKKAEDYVKPGANISFVLKLVTNNAPGEYIGTWKLRDDEGNYFGSMVWVKYVIK